MHIETLKTFCDLVETGSFGKAAQLNFVSQSAVSQQLKALEVRYGRTLIERARHRPARPTDAGRLLYAECKELLERFRLLDARVRRSADTVSGTVRIATVYSIGLHELPPYVTRFMKAHPLVKVHIEYSRTDKVCDACAIDAIDFGIVAFPIRRAGLTVMPWHDEPLVLVCAPRHPLARRRRVSVRQIHRADFVAFERDIPTRRTIDGALRTHGVAVNTVMEFDNIETIKRSVEVNSGVSILPETTVVNEVRSGLLVKVALAEGPFTRAVGIIHRRSRILSAAAQAFVQLLRSGTDWRGRGGKGVRSPACRMTTLLVLVSVLTPAALVAQDREIGRVSFFGADGFDVKAIRDALPIREGDRVPLDTLEADATQRAAGWRRAISNAVGRIAHVEPTGVDIVCCDERGRLLVYVGLPGASIRPVRYNPPPGGAATLPEAIVRAADEIAGLLFKAVAAGRAAEDHSQGYSLAADDPALRTRQLAWRDEVRRHAAEVFEVVRSARDPRQRGIAALALGYLPPSDAQVGALVSASFDPDDGVRNNAVRTLAVLLVTRPERGARVPGDRFIELLHSPVWSDRNKGLLLLQALTVSRNPDLLQQLQRARGSLVEMAGWPKGHAVAARVILGRMLGIAEAAMASLVNEEPPESLMRLLEAPRERDAR